MANDKIGSLRVNFMMNTILTVSSLLFPLITFPYVSRILLAEGNGKVQLAASVVTYFVMLSQLGLPTYGVRACAAVRDDRQALTRTVHELWAINLVMTAVSYVLFFCVLTAVPRLRNERDLYLISSGAILLSAVGMEWLFKALEQYSYITLRSIAFKLISVAAMFLLVRSEGDYVLYAGISVFASYGSNLLNLTQLHRFIGFRPVGGYRLRRHLKPVLVFFAMSCAATIYTNLDSVMLGFLATDADVGYYGVAVKIKNILVSVVTALGTVLLPRVSYYWEQGQVEAFRKLIARALRFVTLLSFPLTAYFMLFAGRSIFFLSGDTYAPSIAPMIAIMPTLIFIGFTNIMGMQVLVPTGRERVVLYSTVGGAVTDLIVNAALIPSMQALGAAIGTLIAEAVVLVIQYAALRHEMESVFRSLGLGRVLAAVAISSGASCWVGLLPLGDFPVLMISAILFFGVYALVLCIAGEPAIREARTLVIRTLKKRKRNSG